MLDVLTVIGVLSTTHKTLSAMFAAGRDIEQCAGDLQRWFSAAQDLEQHEREVKNPSSFNKIFRGKEIERSAISIFAAKKKYERQRLELKNFIISHHGIKGWDDLLKLETKIRKQRTQAIYAQREFNRRLKEWLVIIALLALMVVIVIGVSILVKAGY